MNELTKNFKKNAELTTATVEVVSSSEVFSTIESHIENESKLLAFLNNDIAFTSEKFITHPSDETLKNTNTCISTSLCGIASTGSVVINNDLGFLSYSTMLSKKHIVLLSLSKIFEKPRDIFQNDELLNISSISIITGPSATADMGSLVRGVHGPEKLHIIIIEDEK